jgi:hypothetical protein
MNINEALKLAKEKADGFNETPVETEESILFFWDDVENDSANIDKPIIRIDKKTKEIKFTRYLDLSELELKEIIKGEN